MKVNEQLLSDYTDTLPFATMVDLAPAGQFSLDPLDFNNTIELGSDWLAPKIITLHENATIKLPNGQSLRVELYIDYYETAALWLAREVAREYLSMDKRSSHYQELQLPDLNVDYSFAYNAISPTLIVQEENKVMRVSLYQTSSDYNIPVDVWVRTFVDSIK
ncbi:hypothetical protein SDC9_198608 [bioreactor metagenome]|uniref:Uncharacterized protein n=1 Tax=bioreactor metagenome TaxID=1076179 RepID=A0A645II43_9ZZZZ